MGSGASKSKPVEATPASPEKPPPPEAAAEKIAAPMPAPEATIPPVNVEVEPEPAVAVEEVASVLDLLSLVS